MSRRSKQTLGDSPIGAVLRAIRVNRGLSLKETARLVGVSPANLSRTERGLPGGVHPRHLERIAGVFGSSIAMLYALAAAVAGGFATICAMPNTRPSWPTVRQFIKSWRQGLPRAVSLRR